MGELIERKMAVKDVADALGVTPEAIKRHVREMYPELIKNGVATLLNEEQVTEIKKRMIPTTKVVGAVTALEKAQTIQLAMQYLKETVEELQAQSEQNKRLAEAAERRLAECKPKVDCYNDLADRSYCKNLRDTAAYCGLKQHDFMACIVGKYVYVTQHGEYRAYAEYQKYFTLRPFKRGGVAGNQLMVNMEGLAFLKKRLGGEQCAGQKALGGNE